MAVHMSTVISRELGHITEHLSKLQPVLSQHPLLYTISVSQNTRSSDLSTLVTSLKGLSRGSVGCLSAAIPSAGSSWRQHTSVSFAAFDETYATLFRSTIPGRKATQVGRWHAMHKDAQPDPEEPAHGEENMPDWDTALAQAYDGQALPAELESLRADDVHSILYFSDNAPEGLTSSLSKFGSATKLGLIGTSTPFVTGRPYTLFHNDRIHSDGAVGVCLSSGARPTTYSVFPGLEAITRPMIVTSSEGNLVNSLDNANPSGLLLHALKNHPAVAGSAQGISPELRLYIGTLQQKAGGHELVRLSYIMSGDPSRGSIALDTDAAPAEGALVQMFLLPPSASPDVLGEIQKHSDTTGPRLAFASTSLDEAEVRSISEEVDDNGATVLEDTFLAASENGCIVSRSAEGESERPWKCAVPGATMGLQWAA